MTLVRMKSATKMQDTHNQARARAPPKSQCICVLLASVDGILRRPSCVFRQQTKLEKRRSEQRRRRQERRRLTEEAEGSRSGLTTARWHRELSKVGPIHLSLHLKSRPKRRKQKAAGEGQQVQAGAGAGRLASGCLPRIHLWRKRLTKQSWSLTNFGLISRLLVGSDYVL